MGYECVSFSLFFIFTKTKRKGYILSNHIKIVRSYMLRLFMSGPKGQFQTDCKNLVSVIMRF